MPLLVENNGIFRISGWWFQNFFMFTPNLGEMIQFDEHIIQMGWFNHQHEKKRNGSAGGKSLQLPETNIFAPENDGFQVQNLLFQGGGEWTFYMGTSQIFPITTWVAVLQRSNSLKNVVFCFLLFFPSTLWNLSRSYGNQILRGLKTCLPCMVALEI